MILKYSRKWKLYAFFFNFICVKKSINFDFEVIELDFVFIHTKSYWHIISERFFYKKSIFLWFVLISKAVYIKFIRISIKERKCYNTVCNNLSQNAFFWLFKIKTKKKHAYSEYDIRVAVSKICQEFIKSFIKRKP